MPTGSTNRIEQLCKARTANAFGLLVPGVKTLRHCLHVGVFAVENPVAEPLATGVNDLADALQFHPVEPAVRGRETPNIAGYQFERTYPYSWQYRLTLPDGSEYVDLRLGGPRPV